MHANRLNYFAAISSIILWLAASTAYAQCTKDTECKGDRICERGACTSPAPASAQPAAPQNLSNHVVTQAERVSAALQDQLRCEDSPEPGKALRALKQLGFIGKKPIEAVDGMTIWNFVKPVTVFGYKAIKVTGWENKPDGVYFWRGPGTAPRLHLTVVVEGEATAVEGHTTRFYGTNSSFTPEAHLSKGKQATAITCYVSSSVRLCASSQLAAV